MSSWATRFTLRRTSSRGIGKGRPPAYTGGMKITAWIALGVALTLAPPRGADVRASESVAHAAPLRFRLTAEPATLDWSMARSSHETYVIMNLMEGLVSESPELHPQPALAQSWEMSPDGKTYTFQIRPGVKWSDGRVLKAQDFVDSWIRLLDAKTGSSYASFLFDLENADAFHSGRKKSSDVGVKALGDNKLQLKLKEPVPYFLHLLSFWVTFPIRSDLVKKHGSAWAKAPNLATLGPYLLEEWAPGKMIRLRRNPQYYGVAPGIERVEARIEPDDGIARRQFEAGELDFLLDATTGDLMKAASSGGRTRVEQFPYLVTYYLGFNLGGARPLAEATIRKALGSAIERDKIPSILQGGQVPAKGWIPPGLEGGSHEAWTVDSLFEARGALAKAGFTESEGFPKLRLWVEKFDGASKLGGFIQQSLHEKLGIECSVRIADSASEYQAALKAGKADLFVGHWGADFPDAINFLEVFSAKSGTNATGWKNAEYDRMLAGARMTLDPEARQRTYALAEKTLVEKEAVIFPLFHRKNAVLLGSRIGEFRISPLNYLFLRDVSFR